MSTLLRRRGPLRPNVLQTRNTYNPQGLPAGWEDTGLNEPWPLPGWSAGWTVRLLCHIGTPLTLLILLRLLTFCSLKWTAVGAGAIALWATWRAYRRFKNGLLQAGHLWLALGTLAALPLCALQTIAAAPAAAYVLVFTPALAIACGLSHLLTTQALHHMAVNPWLEPGTSQRWRRYWDHAFRWKLADAGPAAVRNYRSGYWSVFAGWLAGLVALTVTAASPHSGFAGSLALLAFCVGAGVASAHLVDPPSWASPTRLLSLCWQAVVLFFAYQPPDAPGLFRFPSRRLRPFQNRLVASAVTLVLLGSGIVAFSADAPWLAVATDEGGQGRVAPAPLGPLLVGWTLAFPLTHFGPFLVVFVVLAVTGGPVLLCYHEALVREGAPERGRGPRFRNRIRRVLYGSRLEREHLFLFITVHGGIPVYLHRSILHLHLMCRGGTGSGKTSIGFMAVLTQLMLAQSPERLAWLHSMGEKLHERASFVIFDLGGDRAALEIARRTAAECGVTFKLFTVEGGNASHIFNPVSQSHVPDMSISQLVQEWLQALALEMGDRYGASFFASVMEVVLLAALKAEYGVESFGDLDKLFSNPALFSRIARERDWEHARHLAAVARRLSVIEPLNLSEKDVKDRPELAAALRAQIDMKAALREPTCIYFWLPATRGRVLAASIAKLAQFALLSAVARRKADEKNRVYVFIDEYQEVVTRNVSVFLTQARKFGCTCVLAHQSIEQLKDVGADLRGTSEANTGGEFLFKFSDPASRKRVQELIPEAMYSSLKWDQDASEAGDTMQDGYFSVPEAAASQGGLFEPGPVIAGVSERVDKLWNANDLSETSSDRGKALFRATEEAGFTRFRDYFTPVAVEHTISQAEYDEYKDLPWPEPTGETVIVQVDSRNPARAAPAAALVAPPEETPATAGGGGDPLEDALEERLRRAWEQGAEEIDDEA